MTGGRRRLALRAFRGLLGDERGSVLAIVAVALIPLLAAIGLALDGGRLYLARSQLSRAVDAGALAAARALRQGQAAARQEVLAVAAANGVRNGVGGVTVTVQFGASPGGEQTVLVQASEFVPTVFMRIIGNHGVNVGSAAEATIPPVDLVLVLDRSGSLAQQGAWSTLQSAARDFVAYFDDNIDQLGLVSFQVRAAHALHIQHGFKVAIISAVNQMNSVGDTNTGEGLRLGYDQLQEPAVRPRASKVVVFFTDGRPTAFRGSINGRDRVLAVYTTQGNVRGYFDNPDLIPMNTSATPNGCSDVPNCYGWSEPGARNQARQNGLDMADQIRSDSVLVYTIALGNPGASNPLLTPDLAYLREIANENGVADPGQPQGRSYFAPSAQELRAVFRQVAEDLIVRLTR